MHDLRRAILIQKDPEALAAAREFAYKERSRLNKDRVELLGLADGWTSALHDKWVALATPEQVTAHGPYQAPWTNWDYLNWVTKWGLVVSGACLILGLLTPLAALYAAGFLALIYLSVPPWPGLPASPIAEGNYWIVNKNLVEMLACLVLASTPSGLWLGIDALLFGWIGRRREAEQFAAGGEDGEEGGSNGHGRVSDPRRPVPVSRRTR
jgi:uncharacterized membrane protein YphA (DoxX/SURF4 family)